MYQIKGGRYVEVICVPAIFYSRTVHATKPRLLKPFINGIVFEMFIGFPWKLTTNRQTGNAPLEVLINYTIV
jgi:hypothetical protein